jgi:uncharacterized membrane protein YphA (DoxX/SURF4 family)
MIHNIMKDLSDAQWAHGLARIGLGINIALHGWTRIPMIHEFAAGMRVKFEPSFLPVGLVGLSSYGIVIAESVIGAMLLAGWQMRATLIAGHLLMFTLLFGAARDPEIPSAVRGPEVLELQHVGHVCGGELAHGSAIAEDIGVVILRQIRRE